MCVTTKSSEPSNVRHFQETPQPPGASERQFHYTAIKLDELPGWNAVLRFEDVGGVARLRELRIIAGDIDAQIDRHETLTDLGLDLSEIAPDAELTSTMLRKVAIDRLSKLSRTGIHPELAALPRLQPFLIDRARPGRRGRDDIDYAKLAQQYVNEVNSGNPKPTKTLAETHHVSPSQMSQLINTARQRNLLTPAPKGRSGGELTEHAYALLNKDDPHPEEN